MKLTTREPETKSSFGIIPETHKGLKSVTRICRPVLTDACEYSIVQVLYLESDRLYSVGLLAYVPNFSARNHR